MPPSRMRAMNVLKELRSVLESGLSVCLEHESAVSSAVICRLCMADVREV
jgi:hypothetical protein